LYDADLLDDFDQIAPPLEDDDIDLEAKAVESLDLEDSDLEEPISDADGDEDEDLETEAGLEDLVGAEDGESWSDDPVRMYLTQMGQIPLLTRQQEIALAKQIEVTRARFRRRVVECDYVMQQIVRTLRRVHEGELPFDHTVQVSVSVCCAM